MSTSPPDGTALAREYAAGKSIRDLARTYGCSQRVIFDRLAAADAVRMPRRSRRLSAGERRAVAAGYRSGEPLADIAARFGVNVGTVRHVAAAAGTPGRSVGSPRELDYRRIQALAAKGMSAEEIAAKVGSTPGTIKQLLRRLRNADPAYLSGPRKGVKRRRGPRSPLDLDVGAMAAQYAAGTLVEEIARTHGCSVSLVYQRLRRAGVQPNRQGKPRVGNREEIAAAYAAGRSMLDICATFGVNKTTAGRLVSEAEVEQRPAGAPRVTDWATITQMADAGHSSKEIASAVGCSTRNVTRVLGACGYAWIGRQWRPPADATAAPGRKPAELAPCAP
ncbi:hypothetical protein ACQP10_37950 (plasmid) [Streptosporangium sandarakinum]|uniref:hypothetical protein n=1 Tax=Streptosporangium sandarakinum TaxID=1260955 RepID=UPI003D8DE85C